MRKASEFGKKHFCGSRSGISGKTKANRALDEAVIIKDFCKDIVGNPDYDLPNLKDLEKEIAASYSDEVIYSIEETQKHSAIILLFFKNFNKSLPYLPAP